jgi:hypothetical protein
MQSKVRLGKALYVSLGVGVSILVALGFAYLVNCNLEVASVRHYRAKPRM